MKTYTSLIPEAEQRPAAMLGRLMLAAGALGSAGALYASTDYGPAIWRPVNCAKYSTTGYGHRFIVIHSMEGYYQTGTSYLRQCGVQASCHYTVNGRKDYASDAAPGEISQLVREAYYAWHATCWNRYSLGTEHEGFVGNPAWFTDEMYKASAALHKHMAEKFGIAKDRNHIIAHGQKSSSAWRSWMYSQGYSSSFVNCNTHTDPGPYWNWTHFMNLIKGTSSAPAAPSGLAAEKVNASQIKLTWKDNSSNESGFKIERATASGGPFTQIATVGANVKTYTSTGLKALTTYWFRVRAYNSAGNSGYSNTDSAKTDGLPPAAPGSLAATTVSTSQIKLTWKDNSSDETGFKIERATSAGGTYTQIATVGANVTTYANTGLSGSTTYYYRIRSYNTWGNSAYTAVASSTTANVAPVLAAIPNKTVNEGSLLQFSVSATDADEVNATQTITDFESYEAETVNGTVMFRHPGNSGSTSGFLTTATNYTTVVASGGGRTSKMLKGQWTFGTSKPNPWVRLTTYNTTSLPNPTVGINQRLKFDIYSSKALKVGLGIRETGTTAAIGANGGTTGTIEWVGVNGSTSGTPTPTRSVAANTWTTLSFNIPFEPVTAFTGDGVLQRTTGKGVLEHLALVADGGTGAYTIYLDNFVYVRDNNITYSLIGAPAGASIDPTTGRFTWTPTEAQGPGTYTITVKATDAGSPPQSDTQTFTVTVNEVYDGPRLATIPNKSVNEGALLSFTAIASNSNPALTLTFSLDAGAPAGASINPVSGLFTWTPSEAQGPGSYPITVRVTDNGSPAKSDARTFTVTVAEVNTAPVLAAIPPQTVDELTLLSFAASVTDADLPGDQITFSLDAGAPPGAAIDPETGVFTWLPTEAQGPGVYMITVRATDDGSPALSASQGVTITVREVNTPPALAAIPSQRIRPTRPLTFAAVATDPDLPANPLTFSLDPGAPAGAAIDPATGVFTWTPTPLQNNTTNLIKVRVSDGWASDVKNVVVVVSDANNPPVLAALPDKTVNEKTALTFTASASDPDGDSLTYSLAAGAPSGASINPATGAFSWTPTEAQGPGTYSITVRVTDNALPNLSDARTFTVTVNEVNLAPALNPISNKTINEKATLTFTAVASDADLPANTKTFSLDAGAPAGASIDPVTGVFTWTPTEAQGPAIYPITVRVTDNNPDAVNSKQMSDARTFTVTVNEVNEAPVLPAIATKTINEKSTLTLALAATDADLPANTLTYSLDSGAPAGASLNPATGVFTWTPTEAQGPSTNTITVRVTDDAPTPATDSRTFTIIVNEVNEAPVLAALANKTIAEGGTLSFTAAATDADLPANTLTFSLASAPAGATIHPSSGAFTWTPTGAQAPSTNLISLKVTDNGTPALSDTKTFTVVVTSPNQPPVLNAIADKTVDELTTLTFTATASDPESAWAPITITTFENFAAPTVNGTVMFRHPAFSGSTSAFVDSAATNYSKVVSNFPSGHSGSKVLQAAWTFKAGTTNPWVRLATYDAANLPNPTIYFGHVLKFDMYTDKALKVGLALRETSTVAAIGANGGTSGTVELVGVPGMIGASPIPSRTIAAGAWATVSFSLPDEAVTALTGNGVLESMTGKGILDALVLVPAGGLGAYKVYLDNFVVAPANTLTFSLDAGAPAGASINPVTGVFTWTPTEAQGPGVYPITVRVTDNGQPPKSATRTFTVTVNDVNNAPVVAAIPNKTVNELSLVTFTASATDSDGDPFTWSLDAGAPAGATINPATGVFAWTPSEAQGPGTYSITVRATDNGTPPMSGSRTFSVTVNEVNTAPVLSVADQTVLDGQTLSFNLSASDADLPANTLTFSLVSGPAGATVSPAGAFSWTPPAIAGIMFNNFEAGTNNRPYGFKEPRNSATTTSFLQELPNEMVVVTNAPSRSGKAGRFNFAFVSTATTNWVRLTTYNAGGVPNPLVDLNHLVRFDIYSTRALKVSMGIRETGGAGPVGANGGATGNIEWIGATVRGTASVAPGGKSVSANSWQTLTYDLKGDPCEGFMGNDILEGNWGVLESLAVTKGDTSASLTNTIYVDNFRVVPKTNYTVAVTVRVTDSTGLSDTRSFNITVYTSPVEQAQGMLLAEPLAKANAIAPAPRILSTAMTSDGFNFSFGTETGKTYDVEYAESLVNPKWKLLLTVAGDGRAVVINDPTPPISGQRFYRFRIR
ncbi:MAG TPA: putative Ig domain-containing protein [Verrucomicrobiota bacterium]|nr:putative Ig domain-containing protein [Verrucomicrobiota bacterium]HQB73628.1 putative Ig domain-containing protein [Verrucomicrobiota bacterium]